MSTNIGDHAASGHAPPHPEHGSDDPLSMRVTSSLSSTNHPRTTGDLDEHHASTGQCRYVLPGLPYLDPSTSAQDRLSHRRKRSPSTHDPLDDTHAHVQFDDAFVDGADPRSPRRVRPRLRRDLEFSPLIYITPPDQEGDHVATEETILYQYPSNVIDVSRSIQRIFYPGNADERGPSAHVLQGSTSLQAPGDLEGSDRRSDTAGSFAPTHRFGRLSTLQDIWLPHPFETGQPSIESLKVHERGLDAPVSFFGGQVQTGGLPHQQEHSVHTGSPPVVAGPTYFDEPVCDSPESMYPSERVYTS